MVADILTDVTATNGTGRTDIIIIDTTHGFSGFPTVTATEDTTSITTVIAITHPIYSSDSDPINA